MPSCYAPCARKQSSVRVHDAAARQQQQQQSNQPGGSLHPCVTGMRGAKSKWLVSAAADLDVLCARWLKVLVRVCEEIESRDDGGWREQRLLCLQVFRRRASYCSPSMHRWVNRLTACSMLNPSRIITGNTHLSDEHSTRLLLHLPRITPATARGLHVLCATCNVPASGQV